MHPLNNTQQTRTFIRRNVDIHDNGGKNGAQGKTGTIGGNRNGRSKKGFADLRSTTAKGANLFAQLLSIALFETPLLRRWRDVDNLDFVVIPDSALSEQQISQLKALMILAMNHFCCSFEIIASAC